jgi:DNA-binding response OmpR family regulator
VRILIIEDEPEVASTLADALTLGGHTPTIALTGAEGLDRIAADPPQAVFLDVKLPGVSGLEVLRTIRERDPALPVVILTGHATREEVRQARHLGVIDVLQKPWPLKRLDAALADLGRRGRARSAPG